MGPASAFQRLDSFPQLHILLPQGIIVISQQGHIPLQLSIPFHQGISAHLALLGLLNL